MKSTELLALAFKECAWRTNSRIVCTSSAVNALMKRTGTSLILNEIMNVIDRDSRVTRLGTDARVIVAPLKDRSMRPAAYIHDLQPVPDRHQATRFQADYGKQGQIKGRRQGCLTA